MKTCVVAATIVAVSLAFSTSASAQAQPRDYLSQLTNVRASGPFDGKATVSVDAALGDLRGMLTLSVDADGTGNWVFFATYLQDLRADGAEIAPNDHENHEHDDPATPALHREYMDLKHDGSLIGTITSSSLKYGLDGKVIGIESAELVVTSGSRRFENVTGSGRVGAWPSLPNTLTLLLSF